MKVCVYPIPVGDDTVSFLVWLVSDRHGDEELLNLHHAPTISAVVNDGNPITKTDVAGGAMVISAHEVPGYLQRLSEAAAATQEIWRRYDPGAVVEVVESSDPPFNR